MLRGKAREAGTASPMLSIIGPGMQILGDCVTDGTLRVEGSLTGTVYAGKGVVVGKDGTVTGDVKTHDAVISGTLVGTLQAASRLEIQASAHVRGAVHAPRLQLHEGAALNGEVHVGEVELGLPPVLNGAGETPEPGTGTEPTVAGKESVAAGATARAERVEGSVSVGGAVAGAPPAREAGALSAGEPVDRAHEMEEDAEVESAREALATS